MKLIIKTLHKNSGQIILKLFIFITLLIGATYIGISLQQKSTLQVQASTDTCAYQGGYCALGRDCKTSFIDDDNYCSKLHGSKYGCCIRDSGPPPNRCYSNECLPAGKSCCQGYVEETDTKNCPPENVRCVPESTPKSECELNGNTCVLDIYDCPADTIPGEGGRCDKDPQKKVCCKKGAAPNNDTCTSNGGFCTPNVCTYGTVPAGQDYCINKFGGGWECCKRSSTGPIDGDPCSLSKSDEFCKTKTIGDQCGWTRGNHCTTDGTKEPDGYICKCGKSKPPPDGTGKACSADSNPLCTGRNLGDVCTGSTVCTNPLNETGSDGKPLCKCNTGGDGGDRACKGGGTGSGPCSVHSNPKCEGINVGDVCNATSGTRCTSDGSQGPDGNVICKCCDGSAGGLACVSATIDKPEFKTGETATLSATSSQDATDFFFEVRNPINPDENGIPRVVCVTSGGDIKTQSNDCPPGTGSYPLLFKDPDTTLRRTGNRTLQASELVVHDWNIWQPNGGGLNSMQIFAYVAVNNGPWSPTSDTCKISAAYYRPAVCAGSSISGNTLSPATPLEITMQGNPPAGTNITNFYLALYNKDNPYGPDNPKPLCVQEGIGNGWPTVGCPAGSILYAIASPSAGLTSNTFTLNYDDFQYEDKNWNNKLPVNVQTNGYFLLDNTGFSAPEAACVKSFKIERNNLTPTATPSGTLSPTPTPIDNWYAPDGSLCVSQIYRRLFSDTGCTNRIGFQTDTINEDTPEFHCTTWGELVDRDGWTSLGEIPDNGMKFQLSIEDELPKGFRAETEDGSKKIELDDTVRTMPLGPNGEPTVWNVYRLCQDDPPIVPVVCTTDGSLECFKAGGQVMQNEPESFNMSDDETCAVINEDNPVTGDILHSVYKCPYTLPPTGTISGTLTVNYKNREQFAKILVYLVLNNADDENPDTADTYIATRDYNNSDIPDPQPTPPPIDFSFDKLYADRTYQLYAKAFNENGVYLINNVVYESKCKQNPNCELIPGEEKADFTITFEEELSEELTAKGLNEAYMQMIILYGEDKINALQMSEFLQKVKDAPGLKSATFDPNVYFKITPAGTTR